MDLSSLNIVKIVGGNGGEWERLVEDGILRDRIGKVFSVS